MPIRALLLLILLGSTSLFAQMDKIPEKYQINGYQEFGNLSVPEATKKVQALARKDYKRGIYRIFITGMPFSPDMAQEYLQTKYSVYTIALSGCDMTESILGARNGYNEIMKPLLIKRFGRDIFAEAKQQEEKAKP
ncbi:MAG: hypothetical protein ABIP97_05465 [Chthoniobacterales bacterium]